MDLFFADRVGPQLAATPPTAAGFRAVFWEPVSGTGERIVALIAVESRAQSQGEAMRGTYCVLTPDRLRSLLGRHGGASAYGVLQRTAEFMTERQRDHAVTLEDLHTPFFGFTLGPVLVARGYSVDQLLNAAVRSVSSFGTTDEFADDEDIATAPRDTVRTAEFLKAVKRAVAGDDVDVKARFEKRLVLPGTPEMTVDYAFRHWLLQVTSLPATRKQAIHAQREAQSKLFELEQLRRVFGQSPISPVILINEDALVVNPTSEAEQEAGRMLERLVRLSGSLGVEVMQAASPSDGAKLVVALQ